MKIICSLLLVLCFAAAAGQHKNAYHDSIIAFQKAYVDSHEVVGKTDKQYFRFFAPDKKFDVVADFTAITDTTGFIMKSSGTRNSRYFKYGTLNFYIDHKPYQLRIYRSEQLMSTEKYKDYLFVPYTDLTSGEESYGGGKYLDFNIDDIIADKLTVDFNKAYNPYCVYASGYNCPIPPRENNLDVAIKAGEKDFAKKH